MAQNYPCFLFISWRHPATLWHVVLHHLHVLSADVGCRTLDQNSVMVFAAAWTCMMFPSLPLVLRRWRLLLVCEMLRFIIPCCTQSIVPPSNSQVLLVYPRFCWSCFPRRHNIQVTRAPGPVPGIGTKITAVTDPDGFKTVLVDEEDIEKELFEEENQW